MGRVGGLMALLEAILAHLGALAGCLGRAGARVVASGARFWGPEPGPVRRPGEGGPWYKGGRGPGAGARDLPYMYICVYIFIYIYKCIYNIHTYMRA